MPKIITLTKDSSSAKPVFINVEAIHYFFRNENYTKIVFNSHADNSRLLVKETPEQILKLLNEDVSEASLPKGNIGKAFRGEV